MYLASIGDLTEFERPHDVDHSHTARSLRPRPTWYERLLVSVSRSMENPTKDHLYCGYLRSAFHYWGVTLVFQTAVYRDGAGVVGNYVWHLRHTRNYFNPRHLSIQDFTMWRW